MNENEDLNTGTPEEEIQEGVDENEVPEEEIEEGVDEEGEDSNDDDSEVDDVPDDFNPSGRKSNTDFVIKRLKAKNAKLQAQVDGGADDGDQDNDLEDPELDNHIQKHLKPLQDKLISDTDNAELERVLSINPDAKKYEKRIRKYMDSPSYATVPIEFIVNGVMAEMVGKKTQADAKANKSKAPGKPAARPKASKAKTAWEMTPEEFAANKAKLLSGGGQ